jgi:hypothetical protein
MAVLALFMVEKSLSFSTPMLIKATPSSSSVTKVPSVFIFASPPCVRYPARTTTTTRFATENDGVVELAVDEEEMKTNQDPATTSSSSAVVAPFLSQGEIAPEALAMDWSDPKQARVMIYIILSLVPILFLIPLMIGSRDLIPLEMLPPVTL